MTGNPEKNKDKWYRYIQQLLNVNVLSNTISSEVLKNDTNVEPPRRNRRTNIKPKEE